MLIKRLDINIHKSFIHNSQKTEQPKCPPNNKRISKFWSIHTMGYYSAIKKNGLPIHATKWSNFKIIMLRKINQHQNSAYEIVYLRKIF